MFGSGDTRAVQGDDYGPCRPLIGSADPSIERSMDLEDGDTCNWKVQRALHHLLRMTVAMQEGPRVGCFLLTKKWRMSLATALGTYRSGDSRAQDDQAVSGDGPRLALTHVGWSAPTDAYRHGGGANRIHDAVQLRTTARSLTAPNHIPEVVVGKSWRW